MDMAMLSINSLEALPIISKSSFKSKEKILLGAATVFTLGISIALIVGALLLKATTPKEPAIETSNSEAADTTPVVIYDSISILGFKNAVTHLMTQDSLYSAGVFLEKILQQNANDTFALRRMISILIAVDKKEDATLFLDKLKSLDSDECANLKFEIALLTPKEVLTNYRSGEYTSCLSTSGITNTIADKVLGIAPEVAKELIKGERNTSDKLYLLQAKEKLKESFSLTPEIEKLLINANKNSPLNFESHLILGELYLKAKKSDLAQKELEIALRLSPNNHIVCYHLGILYFKQRNNPQKGATFFEKALKLENSHWESALQLGLIFQKLGKPTGAIHYFNQSLQYAPNNTRILLQLGAAYEQSDKKNKALETYEEILKIDNQNDIALYKIKILKKD